MLTWLLVLELLAKAKTEAFFTIWENNWLFISDKILRIKNIKFREFLILIFQCIFFQEQNLLVLPFNEISLWSELSSPSRFRIQGGSPECLGGGAAAATAGLKLLCIVLDAYLYSWVFSDLTVFGHS